MKKILILLTCCFIAQWAGAQTPKWVEKARKAVFSIVTYDKNNQIKGTGNGFYIDDQGTSLSDYTLFEGADRAVIINAEGKQLEVNSILGANSIYDVIKFKTPTVKKQVTLTLATQPAKVNDIVYLLPYSTQKATTCQTGRVTAVDSIGNNSFYYTLEMKTGEKLVSCPIMNAEGQVLGLIQKNASDDSTESYAIGAGYGASLSISALSITDATLNKINIKKALPEVEDQAMVYLIMAADRMNPEEYTDLLNDFIALFPNNYEGYIRMANLHIYDESPEKQALADSFIEKALKLSANKDEACFQVAKTIYSYMISMNGKETFSTWTYDRALEIIRQSIQKTGEPLHIQLEGDILFAQRKYDEAFLSYEKVNNSPLASAATYFSAAKTKQLMEGSDVNEVLALMDTAIEKLRKPYLDEAAPYFFERAELRAQAGKFKEAVLDYNTFYNAVAGKVSALFYFKREQAEVQCRMYQQALDDINKAVEMEPQDLDFLIEKGAFHLRVNQLEEAVEVLNKVISINGKYAAAYRMLGYCQALQKKNKEACKNFAIAKELGDEVVDTLIEKYCK